MLAHPYVVMQAGNRHSQPLSNISVSVDVVAVATNGKLGKVGQLREGSLEKLILPVQGGALIVIWVIRVWENKPL